MNHPAVRLLISLVLYQAAWLACVASAAAGRPALGVAAIAASVALQVAGSRNRRADAWLMAGAVVVGIAWDTAMARAGWVVYASPGPLADWAPAWIVALWVQFASILREPLRWLHGRPLAAALFGAVGGPLSYAAAARMGACTLPNPTLALAVLAAGWAVCTPLLLALAQRLDAPAPAPRAVTA